MRGIGMSNDNGFLTGTQLMQKIFPPVTMLTLFLPSRSFVLISGTPGAGKTEFFIQQAIEIASRGKVIFFCNEGGLNDLQQRQNAYCKNQATLDNLIWPQRGFPNFKDTNGVTQLEFIINKFLPIAIFIDPGPDAFGEENDAAVLKEPLQRIGDLVEKYQLCLVLSWHTPKITPSAGVYTFRGSSAIAAKTDAMYELRGYAKKRRLQLHKLRPTCQNLYQGKRWNVERSEHETGKLLKITDVKEALDMELKTKHKQELEMLNEFTPGELYTKAEFKEIFSKHTKEQLSESGVKRVLDKFIANEIFTLIEKGKGTKPARYRFNGVDTS